MTKNLADDVAIFLPARKVLKRYGISDMTLWRWLQNESLSFPRPIYIGRYRYFRISDLDAWDATREHAVPRAA